MSSLRRIEGYYLSDNRLSGGALIESATLTCSHCHQQLILNPDRSRPREYCPGCHRYLCDGCALVRKVTLSCKTKRQIMEEMAEAIVLAHQAQTGLVLIAR